ncbi:MAG: T9SS type A sorting domain-containing protein [Saprospiraceae bacterium]
MQKTIFFAVLLLYGVSLWGQSTFHKKFQAGGILSATPFSNGEMLGSGTQDQFFAPPQGLLVRFSQDGEVLWRKRYPALNFIWHSVETNNGFVIVGDTVGTTGPPPRPYFSVVSKLSNNGDVIWSKITGDDFGQALVSGVVMGGSNDYLVSGNYSSYSMPSQRKSFFAKLDDNGNTLWSKIYYANTPNHYNTFSAQIIEGDTLYACGNIQFNGCFVRINIHTGEVIGLSSLGGFYHDAFSTLKPTQDGNFILAGYTRSTTGSEESRPWVVKVNRAGQIIWSKTYNLLGTSLTCYMAEANDGGFVLSMGGDNASTTSYAVLAKIDSLGNLVWAYNYAGGQQNGLGGIKATSDGGFVALGYNSMLKTESLGRVNNGCCPAPITFQVENYSPLLQSPVLIAEDRESMTPFVIQAVDDASFTVQDFCQTAITSVVEQIPVCQGDSIQINGSFYQAPQVVRDTVLSQNGGCDTVHVFNLVQVPLPVRVETISFCPGSSVVVSGVTYTQPDTIYQKLPATTGCDTLLVTFLNLKILPKKYETTTFCPGDTVFINGIGYQFPGILPNPDTLPSATIGCDTLLYQVLAYPAEPSSVSVYCPPDMVVNTAPATPTVVNYLLPTATSDCTCPDLYFSLNQGFPSGVAFPIGNTQVCYSASDICGDFETCCFNVKVEEEEACDVKETGCIQYELLGISADAEQNKTYRVRVTNDCASPLSYTAFQIPNGQEAVAPVQNSSYISPNGRDYTVRNPNHSPFRSVRFKPVGNGISGGQSDVFEYTMPAQASPVFIKATTRLASGAFYEVTMNTFGCVLQANKSAERTWNQPLSLQSVRVFPNPSDGELFIDLSGVESGSVHLQVLNIHGQEMAKTELMAGAGIQSFLMPDAMPDGLYFLEMKSEHGEIQTAKFVLQR